MLSRHIQSMRRVFYALVLTVLACAPFASASATLLLEEPYGKLGFFTATGHSAVYLSGVCADSPLVLRSCRAGESGVVISRYDGVGGYDWIAVPLIPYLYAVERPEDIPLFADAKMVTFLRDRYRRAHLEDVAPDGRNGETPGGNWYELVGSSYDRTIYGFQIATTPEQDRALIRKLNAGPNRSHFRTVSRNCADFAKDILDFYYPKAVHRSVIADVGITTPKQIAKMLVKFDRHHPELQSSTLVIAQVPGSMPRSTAVHGVVESFFKSKKYIVPSAVVSPIFAGCVFAVYVGTGAGRFEPARDAMVFSPGTVPETPLDREDFRAYQHELKGILALEYAAASGQNIDKVWSHLQSKAKTGFDDKGMPTLQIPVDGHVVHIGVAAENVLRSDASSQLTRELLEARLQSELRGRSPHGISEEEITRDWTLLQRTMSQSSGRLSARSATTLDSFQGNRP